MGTPAATQDVEGISVSQAGRVATVTLGFSTMSRAFLAWLSRMLDALEREEATEAVIFTGVKSIFMTGADLPEVRALRDDGDALDFLRLPHELMSRVLHLGKVTIAAINGYCLGGGLELALACDFRLAAEDLCDSNGAELAFLGLPEVSLGLVPALAGTWLLEATVGRRNAAELLYSAAPIPASHALRIGLIDQTAPRQALVQAALSKAEAILVNSYPAIRGVKRLVAAKLDGATFDQALSDSALEFAICCRSGDKNGRLDRFHAERVKRFQYNSR
jgi:enoyl-CoA hydratase/carnithine racemase